jgi:hypothetical protein
MRTRRCSGQSMTEYLILTSLLAIALAIGPDSPLEQLFKAFADRYQRFSQEVSHP